MSRHQIKMERGWWALIAVASLFWAGCDAQGPQRPLPQAAAVSVAAVTTADIPVTPSFVAQVQSSHQVDIVARVNGFLDEIAYEEGGAVQKDQVLFRIDSRPFQAEVDAARAEMANREAELWTAKANLERIRPLAALNAASKSDLDNATGRVKSAEAALALAQARLRKSELELSYTTIKSPIAGVASQSGARQGAYLTVGTPEAKLTYVAKIDPVWVEFSVSQNQFVQMQDDIAAGLLVAPDQSAFAIEVMLSDGNIHPDAGRFSFAEPTLNQQTGTFLVRAEVNNPEATLKPGMFVRARIKGAFRPNAVVVPQKAVQQTAKGHMVYVIGPQSTAEARPVIVGEWIGTDWVIRQGLKAGEQLIVDGFQRLRPGSPVKIAGPITGPAVPAEGR